MSSCTITKLLFLWPAADAVWTYFESNRYGRRPRRSGLIVYHNTGSTDKASVLTCFTWQGSTDCETGQKSTDIMQVAHEPLRLLSAECPTTGKDAQGWCL